MHYCYITVIYCEQKQKLSLLLSSAFTSGYEQWTQLYFINYLENLSLNSAKWNFILGHFSDSMFLSVSVWVKVRQKMAQVILTPKIYSFLESNNQIASDNELEFTFYIEKGYKMCVTTRFFQAYCHSKARSLNI